MLDADDTFPVVVVGICEIVELCVGGGAVVLAAVDTAEEEAVEVLVTVPGTTQPSASLPAVTTVYTVLQPTMSQPPSHGKAV